MTHTYLHLLKVSAFMMPDLAWFCLYLDSLFNKVGPSHRYGIAGLTDFKMFW